MSGNVLIVCLTVMAVVTLLCVTAIILVGKGRQERAEVTARHLVAQFPTPVDLSQPEADLGPDGYPAADVTGAPWEEEQVVQQPIPFDPGSPPHWVVYNPRPDAPVRTCHCHDEPLTPGEDVLWWPLPDAPDVVPGSVLLFCKRAVPKA